MTSDTQAAPHARKPRKGDGLTVTIDALNAKGEGVGTVAWPPFGPMRVQVRHAPPGASVQVEVVRRRGHVVDARLTEYLDHGPHHVEARCRHFLTCGGCSFQNLAYDEQLVALRELVAGMLTAESVLGGVEVEPVIGMSDPFHYRNKMDFTFGSKRWVEPGEPEDVDAGFGLGLHVPFRHDKVLDIEECFIAFHGADAIVQTARRLAREQGLEPWDLKTHTGLLRHLVLRHSRATGEVLVYLVTSSEAQDQVRPYVDGLLKTHPEIATLVQGIHGGAATVAWGERDLILHGSGEIRESLLGVEFAIQPKSFFQTNTVQAEALIRVVREEVSQGEHGVLFDLYCGTGSLGLMVCDPLDQLIGIEVVPSAVEDARANAERLGFTNAKFFEGDVRELAPNLLAGSEAPKPDVIIVDPPRAGLHPKVLEPLTSLGAGRMVYVSCNVKNAARDLRELAGLGWELTRVRPLDLFPHTPHVECVLTLEYRS